MRNLMRLASAAVLPAALTVAHSGAASTLPKSSDVSLCQRPEMVLFSCWVEAKVVSICGQKQGGAVYRFGRPDRIELEATDLHFNDHGFSGGGETQVYVDTPTHRYIVYDKVIKTTLNDKGRYNPRETAGLVVQSRGRTVASRECARWTDFEPSTRKLVSEGDYVPH